MSRAIDSVVQQYREYLAQNHHKHFTAFDARMRTDVEAATTEAVVYFVLGRISNNVDIFEDPVAGGPDFQCSLGAQFCLVEATCLHISALEKASGISNTFVEGAQSFAPLTTRIFGKVFDKTARDQLRGLQDPLILCIGSQHIHTSLLMGRQAAATFLTGDPLITFPINDPNSDVSLMTPLKNSLFFRLNTLGEIESCRRSVSAILLLSIGNVEVEVVGIRHPDPEYQLSSDLLTSIPFVYIKKWPPTHGHFEIDWTVPNAVEDSSQSARFKY